jgi:hypothetical protein
MAQTLVLDDGGVADSLVFAEDAVGKHLPLPSHLQAPLGKVVQVDVLTAETFRDIVPIEDDLLAGVGHGQLFADVTLFAVAEDVVQPAGDHVEGSVQVFRSDSTNGKAFVIALKELRQEGVAGVDVANIGKP